MGEGGNPFCNHICHSADLEFIHLVNGFHFFIGFANGIDDLGNIKRHFLAISLDYIRFDVNFTHLVPVFHIEHSPVRYFYDFYVISVDFSVFYKPY